MKYNSIILSLILVLILSHCSDKKERTSQESNLSDSNINESQQNIDKLFDAALNGDLQFVEYCINNGFDVNTQNQDGQTLLMLAGFNGHTEICKYLISSGAHIVARDINGRTALMFTSSGPFPETVKLLLKNEADPNAVDYGEHFTPLMHAAAEGHQEVVQILLENGANPLLKDIDGDNAESFARRNGYIKVADYIKNYK